MISMSAEEGNNLMEFDKVQGILRKKLQVNPTEESHLFSMLLLPLRINLLFSLSVIDYSC